MADQKTKGKTPVETRTYIRTIGRRKESTAQVRLFADGTGLMTVNGRELKVYFPYAEWQTVAQAAFTASGTEAKFDVEAKVAGGGIRGQAESVRLALARALVKFNPDYRVALKKLGLLTRDARIKERKKYGKKKARRSPQWSKR